MNLGMTELVIILVIVLVIFGPSKLPGLGKALGETIKGFKKGMNDAVQEEEARPAQLPSEGSAPQTASQKEKDPAKS